MQRQAQALAASKAELVNLRIEPETRRQRRGGDGHPKKDGHDQAGLDCESPDPESPDPEGLDPESLDLPVTILQSSFEFMELSEAI